GWCRCRIRHRGILGYVQPSFGCNQMINERLTAHFLCYMQDSIIQVFSDLDMGCDLSLLAVLTRSGELEGIRKDSVKSRWVFYFQIVFHALRCRNVHDDRRGTFIPSDW